MQQNNWKLTGLISLKTKLKLGKFAANSTSWTCNLLSYFKSSAEANLLRDVTIIGTLIFFLFKLNFSYFAWMFFFIFVKFVDFLVLYLLPPILASSLFLKKGS